VELASPNNVNLDREQTSPPAKSERVAPAMAGRSGPVSSRIVRTRNGAGNSAVLVGVPRHPPSRPSSLHLVHVFFYLRIIGSCFVLLSILGGWNMPDIDFIRADVEHRRRQVQRLRSEIRQLQHSGISSASAKVLLDRMRNKIDELCAERDRLKKEQPGHNKNRVLGGRRW
jgi:hypothetical protein